MQDIIGDIIDWDQAHKAYLAGKGQTGQRYNERLEAAEQMAEIEARWPHLPGYPVQHPPGQHRSGHGRNPATVPPRSESREPLLRLSLAVRAPESDPLLARVALLGPADRGPAPTAGSACPPVGPGFLAAPDYACGDDACSLLVGLQQSVPKFYEGTQVRHLSDRPGRVRAQPALRLRRIPVRAKQVGAEVADRARLGGCGQDLHDAEQVADGLPGVVGEDQPDPVVAGDPLAGRPHPPRAVHAQVRVHRDAG